MSSAETGNVVRRPPVVTAAPAHVAIVAVSGVGGSRDRDRYQHLTPQLVEFAALAPDDPRRRVLRDELTAALWPLVVHIARRYRGRGEPVEDLEQVGAMGLLGALERFDPARGRDFLGFAVPTIAGEVRNHFRDCTWALRVPRRLKELQTPIRDAVGSLTTVLERAPKPSEIAEHLGIGVTEVMDALRAQQTYTATSLDAVVVGDRGPNTALGDRLGAADATLETALYRDELRRALTALPERDRTIVVLRFFGDLTQSQVAAQVGLSQWHISRVLSRSLVALRAHIDNT